MVELKLVVSLGRSKRNRPSEYFIVLLANPLNNTKIVGLVSMQSG
jgi:hypothetical protein